MKGNYHTDSPAFFAMQDAIETQIESDSKQLKLIVTSILEQIGTKDKIDKFKAVLIPVKKIEYVPIMASASEETATLAQMMNRSCLTLFTMLQNINLNGSKEKIKLIHMLSLFVYLQISAKIAADNILLYEENEMKCCPLKDKEKRINQESQDAILKFNIAKEFVSYYLIKLEKALTELIDLAQENAKETTADCSMQLGSK